MSEGHRLLLLAGSNADELRAQLAEDEGELLARDDAAHAPVAGPYRLAIVDPDARRLALARRVVERGAPWRGRNDVWFSPAPLLGSGGGTIAFVFPGVEQRFEPVIDDIAQRLDLPPPALGGEEHSVLRRSFGLLSVGRFLDAALRRIGIVPASVAGHSIGEWNAMVSAGLYTSAGMDQLIASIDPEAFELPGCLFAALGCGVELAREAIAGIDGVMISHDNCPRQSIICGDEHAIAAATQRLDARGILSQVLNFRSGFHSPLLAPYLDGVSGVAQLPIGTPKVPVWSATTTGIFPAGEAAIRELVIRHLLEPVRFRELIENLYAAGARAFVQPGVGSVTGFIDDTLAGRDYVAVAANVAGQPGLRQLRRTAAALWVEGAQPRFDKLSVTHGIEPVLAELRALLAEAAEAAEAVTARFVDVRSGGGRPVRLTPRETRFTWTLRLDEMPFVIDHCLVRQPAGWHEISDRHPVVPLTTSFELMREVARKLVPERTPIALRNVAALRWLALDKPLALEVTARFDGVDAVEVDLGGYARATVVVREEYPPAPLADTAPFADPHPAPATAAQVYADRWLFHGPRFQGITGIGPFGSDGLRGTVRVLDAEGALIDCAGQLMVFWIMAALEHDRYALPGGVQAVDYFGPQPPAGDQITVTVRIRSMTPRSVHADLELADRNGRLWARLLGFENRRFATDEVTWPALRYPELHTIATTEPGGWVRLRERWSDAATRDLIARRYLDAAEREEFRTRAPRGRRHWLMGRIAAKDAVRRWLWERGSGPLFPVEVGVRNDERGKPVAHAPARETPSVSIAHSGEIAVALAGDGAVGIDVQQIEPRTPGFEELAFSARERALLDRIEHHTTRAEALTRFWAAKEAVAKAEGTGLEGRPTAFEVLAVDGTRLRTVRHDANGAPREYAVDTALLNDPPGPDGTSAPAYIVAWTNGVTVQHARPDRPRTAPSSAP